MLERSGDYTPELCHEQLLDLMTPELAFRVANDYGSWRRSVGVKLRELLGTTPIIVPLDVVREPPEERERFVETRFRFTSEQNADVPCHLLTPRIGSPPYPLVICLQGHTTGMHISLGRPQSDADCGGGGGAITSSGSAGCHST